jgi:hypothetical protein
MSKLQIQEILKGYVVDRGNIQSVGNMTVIPIVSDKEFTNVANTNEVRLSRDPEYGQLEFTNSSGQIGIALQGWTIIDDKQNAQDRTIPFAHLIKAGNSKLIPANCVQARQPGHFDVRKMNHENFMILPPSLRSLAIKNNASYTNGSNNYSALWKSLEKWSDIDCYSGGLTSFYSKYEDKLDLFVAQFEPVEKQLGAIVLINDQIVAIDILPKYESWKFAWRAFIRDSYGAESVRQAGKGNATVVRPMIETESLKTIEKIEEYFNSLKNNFYDGLQTRISQLSQLDLEFQKLEEISELTMIKLQGNNFAGQGVLHGDSHFVYLSLVSSAMAVKPKEVFKSLRNNPYGTTGFTVR